MRPGVLISAAFHVVFVATVLLSAPRQFTPVPEQVEVELVSDKDAPPPPEEKTEEPKPEKPSVWDFPPEKPKFDLPRLEPSEQPKPNTPAASQAAANAKQKATPQPQAAKPQAAQQPEASASQQPTTSTPANSQQAALTPPPTGSPPPQTPEAANAAKPATSIFDPANIPKLMDLPNALDSGFDAEATVQASLSNDERAAFKAHLRKCWKVPDGLAPATRVVLRVNLRPNGALAAEPVLIEASASRDGPTVLQAAKRALKECQPFAFLPADKYKEWKVLDLSFTPRDMAGG